MAEKPQPVKVLYCPICSLPAEYCEFGPDFEKCKPWLISNASDVYPHLLKEATEKEGEKVSEQLQSVGSTVSSKQDVKRLPGGKIKKKEKQEVVIEKVVRNRRKCITIVKGLDLFGIKLSDASKKLGKKFATGASVVKGPTDKEQIDVQGDISYDIVEYITETWPAVMFSIISLYISFNMKMLHMRNMEQCLFIFFAFTIRKDVTPVPETAIFFIEDGKKVPAA
ncbi:translation machinery-associated protein 22 isoform X2 [Gossypium australe]|uniref:Translation machinery-associated protein 22 n=1 Tax=Gossypium australe TaxID=47621 RepID=A0A5B6W717_9ROSI|nr:translation machinery-associated protein 22 isoform X2 [Gossypium australe]